MKLVHFCRILLTPATQRCIGFSVRRFWTALIDDYSNFLHHSHHRHHYRIRLCRPSLGSSPAACSFAQAPHCMLSRTMYTIANRCKLTHLRASPSSICVLDLFPAPSSLEYAQNQIAKQGQSMLTFPSTLSPLSRQGLSCPSLDRRRRNSGR